MLYMIVKFDDQAQEFTKKFIQFSEKGTSVLFEGWDYGVMNFNQKYNTALVIFLHIISMRRVK